MRTMSDMDDDAGCHDMDDDSHIVVPLYEVTNNHKVTRFPSIPCLSPRHREEGDGSGGSVSRFLSSA